MIWMQFMRTNINVAQIMKCINPSLSFWMCSLLACIIHIAVLRGNQAASIAQHVWEAALYI